MSGYWYVATPYSKYPAGQRAAFVMACEETARLVKAGVMAFSPIAHTHPVAIHGGIDPMDHALFMALDQPMMDAACGLIVVMAEGWRESVGVRIEIDTFCATDKPIVHMTPGRVPLRFL